MQRAAGGGAWACRERGRWEDLLEQPIAALGRAAVHEDVLLARVAVEVDEHRHRLPRVSLHQEPLERVDRRVQPRRRPRPPACMGSRRCRVATLQGRNDAGSQRCRAATMQGRNDAGSQRCRVATLQGRNAGSQRCRAATLQGRNAGSQRCRAATMAPLVHTGLQPRLRGLAASRRTGG